MIDAFFVPSFGNRPKHLVGRESVLAQFENVFKSIPGSKERVLLILGQRGTGKTVLLLEFADMAKKRGFIVANPTVVSSGMQKRIIEKLLDECPDYLSGAKKKVSGGNVSLLGFGAGIQFQNQTVEDKSFSWKITEYCKNANADHHGVLILIDEVRSNSEELRELIIAYQEMVGKGLNIAIVLAGLPMSVSSLLNDHVLTFLNRATVIELPALRIDDIELYYRKAFEILGMKLSDVMVRKAAEGTAGSPYLMQLIGHYVTLTYEEGLTELQYEQAIERARSIFRNDICRTSLAPLSEQDKNFLSAMAIDDRESSVEDIATRLERNSSFVQTYKRRLIQCGIIESKSRGKLSFAVPYLKDYIREQN